MDTSNHVQLVLAPAGCLLIVLVLVHLRSRGDPQDVYCSCGAYLGPQTIPALQGPDPIPLQAPLLKVRRQHDPRGEEPGEIRLEQVIGSPRPDGGYILEAPREMLVKDLIPTIERARRRGMTRAALLVRKVDRRSFSGQARYTAARATVTDIDITTEDQVHVFHHSTYDALARAVVHRRNKGQIVVISLAPSDPGRPGAVRVHGLDPDRAKLFEAL